MQRIISVLLVLNFLSFLATCHTVEFTDCGSQAGKVSSVHVSGCDSGKTVCPLVRGTNATLTLEFTTDKEIQEVTAIVHGILMDVPIPFPIPHAKACEYPESGIKCPLAKDTKVTYTTSLPVLKGYPKVSVTVKWELKNEKNEDIVCVMIPAQLQ